jgi:Spx/MgsR family transcriptional regulator
MLRIYGIKNCGSVKKAIAFFSDHNIEFELIDLKKVSVGSEKVDQWLKQVEMKKLFNASSSTYRNLKLKELNLDESAKREWLIKENMLIKRPVVEHNGKVLIAFDEEIYKKEFLS